jgi:hypothetical protein
MKKINSLFSFTRRAQSIKHIQAVMTNTSSIANESQDTKDSIFSSFLNKGVPKSMLAEPKNDRATNIMSK